MGLLWLNRLLWRLYKKITHAKYCSWIIVNTHTLFFGCLFFLLIFPSSKHNLMWNPHTGDTLNSLNFTRNTTGSRSQNESGTVMETVDVIQSQSHWDLEYRLHIKMATINTREPCPIKATGNPTHSILRAKLVNRITYLFILFKIKFHRFLFSYLISTL
jgi:hypothetical protein